MVVQAGFKSCLLEFRPLLTHDLQGVRVTSAMSAIPRQLTWGTRSTERPRRCLRAGMATTAAIHGAEERDIARTTGHKTPALLRRYMRDPRARRAEQFNG